MKILFCLLILFFSCAAALAHSCVSYDSLSDKEYNQKLEEVDNIFEGEVISAKVLGHQSYLIKFKVLRVWKGEQSKEITIRYANPCGYFSAPIEEMTGAKWMVYGYHEKNVEPVLYVNCCTSFKTDRMKHLYGEGIIIEHPAPEINPHSSQSAINEGFWARLWKKLFSFFS